MEELEIKEKIEETEKGHEGSQSSKLRIGLLIAALAALLGVRDRLVENGRQRLQHGNHAFVEDGVNGKGHCCASYCG